MVDLLEVDDVGRVEMLEQKVRADVEDLQVLLGINPRSLEAIG